ncbi:MarR family winged helix-turn-helix transcriptional regulator [Hyphomonas pacifica]|uniref:HTH marR-type domain-containing protein n=1 Tax=Hyphomonas pacifica TaxID=1280941 RepID=A0A062TXR4_9PROT|nr:MarR family transcriptional regulator [Hyphomonas pacifica]KCZ50283.1 hypothetical protein HY2_14495 [Hyphomonas pacifica]RAN32798.1 hypothetical protein HY3_14210 [Hyphomonas pacifica]
MFLLKDLPQQGVLDRFAERYGSVSHARLSLFLEVMRCGSDLLVELDSFLETFDLTHGRWITLVLLMREADETARPVDLAAKQGVTRATMTGLLQRLETDGLVTRMPDREDARSVKIRLTTEGEDLLQKIMPEYYRRIGQLMQGIPDEALATATQIIRQLSADATILSQP